MKELKLSNSSELALVDDEDFEYLTQFTWALKRRTVFRHRALPKAKFAVRIKYVHCALANEVMQNYELMYDHINRDYLNNTKLNLRPATQKQNCHNRTKLGGTSSVYKGVCWITAEGKWMAYVYKSRLSRITLGRFDDEILAAKAYDKAAKEMFGEFAVLNFVC